MTDDQTVQDARAGYERRDLSPRKVALFGLGLAVIIVVSVGVVTLFQIYAGSRYARRQPPRAPLAVTREATEPRLQINAPADLRTTREAEERVLNSYGWVDPRGETVRIPIDRAMEILTQKGLPARQQGDRQQAPGVRKSEEKR